MIQFLFPAPLEIDKAEGLTSTGTEDREEVVVPV